MTRFFISHTARACALWVLCYACAGTETDNPDHEWRQGALRVAAAVRAREVAPGCPPPLEDAPPRDLPLWGMPRATTSSALESGLVVLDVSDPTTPSVVARQRAHTESRGSSWSRARMSRS